MRDPQAIEREAIFQELGADLVTMMSGLLRGLGLYEAHNSVVTRMLDGVMNLTERTGAECLELRLLHDEFFVNGLLLRVDAPLHARAADLAASLGRLGVGSIELGPELTREDLTRLAERLVAGLRGGSFVLDAIGDIRLGRPRGTSIAAIRFQPDRLALYTLAGLVEAVDRVHATHAEGGAVSLVQARRLLRLVVEGMEREPGMYLAVAGVRVPGVAMSRGRRAALRAVLAIGFAGTLSLDRRARTSLGLASLLAGLVEDGRADSAVDTVASFSGAGACGLALLLGIHDTIEIRHGRRGGLAGQIIALTGAWVERVATGTSPSTWAWHVDRVLRGEDVLVDVDLDRRFATWLGRWPVGAVLLVDGAPALVVGSGATPVVRAVDSDGGLGPARTVGDPRGIRVVPHLEMAGVDPTAC